MAARIARNNGAGVPIVDYDGGPRVVLDWNGIPLAPGHLQVVDDESNVLLAALDAGLPIELDPEVGRHYTAPPTERKVRPTP